MEIFKILVCGAALVVLINCAPASHDFEHFSEYDRSAAPDTFFDIDAEQLQARYDPRQLRENISGYLAPATSASASNEDATSCQTANGRFVHGQKVPRNDPCEICLCVDGEIFCWWKICDRRLLKKYPKIVKHKTHRRQPYHHQPSASASRKNANKKKKSSWMRTRDSAALDGIPANERNFPQHLPTHFLHDVQDMQHHHQLEKDESDDETDERHQSDNVDALLNKHKEIETEIESETPPPIRPTATTTTAIATTTNDTRRSGAHFAVATSNTTTKPITDIRSDSASADGVFVVSKTDIPANILSANGNVDEDDDNVDAEEDTDERRPNRIDGKIKDAGMSIAKSANLARVPQPSDATTIASSPSPLHQTGDKLRIITVSPIVIDSRTGTPGIYRSNSTATHEGGVVVASSSAATANERRVPEELGESGRNVERGYYEKTIFNKNGVFIENIRKIANINDEEEAGGGGGMAESTNKVILNAGSSNSVAALHGGGGSSDDEDNDSDDSVEAAAAAAAASMKKIALMSLPLSQHYVITSSGRIEKSDTMATDDIIAQFRDGLNEYQRSYRSSGNDGSALSADDTSHNGDSSVTFLAAAVSTTMASTTAAVSMERQSASKAPLHCIVMGTSYAVGTVLPQESGNCLQCICADGSSDDPSPRVTCSSHNCPPLILPDLFDATGY